MRLASKARESMGGLERGPLGWLAEDRSGIEIYDFLTFYARNKKGEKAHLWIESNDFFFFWFVY